jgi:hypothetical protein
MATSLSAQPAVGEKNEKKKCADPPTRGNIPSPKTRQYEGPAARRRAPRRQSKRSGTESAHPLAVGSKNWTLGYFDVEGNCRYSLKRCLISILRQGHCPIRARQFAQALPGRPAMSIIGVSGQSSNPYLLWQLQNTSSSQSVGSTDSDGDSAGPNTTQSIGDPGSTQNSSGTGDSQPSLVQQLETAIQNALNGTNSSQSNNPQDVLSSIEQAIQTTLQNNGIDPNQLSQAGAHHHRHHHGGGGGTDSAAGVLSATAQGDTGSSATGSSTTTDSSSNSSQTPGLDTLLGQLNVDPQQFRNDLLSGISDSQGGTIDFSIVFQSFPTGQKVNALA